MLETSPNLQEAPVDSAAPDMSLGVASGDLGRRPLQINSKIANSTTTKTTPSSQANLTGKLDDGDDDDDDVDRQTKWTSARQSNKSNKQTGGQPPVVLLKSGSSEPAGMGLRSRASLQKQPAGGASAGQKSPPEEEEEEQNGGDHFEVMGNKCDQAEQGDLQMGAENFQAQLVWRNIILFIILHSSLLFGVRMLWLNQVQGLTLAWSLLGVYISGVGVTGGAHRLWSHRAYKARLPVQLLLMCLQTMAGQNSIYTWCRDHRVHHKFAETNADPHNIKRGFLFAHMGWLCCRKHPEVGQRGASIDLSDLEANKVVMFQHKHFMGLTILFNILLPTYLPVWLWAESAAVSFTFSFMIRYLVTLHGTWLVNSAAHYFGSRPYDERIEARESPFVILTGLGEGFHNYHHTFPFDYSTSEFGHYFNLTTAFIDACAWLGLAYDRRSMSRTAIEQRRARTGDQRNSKDTQREQQQQQQQTDQSLLSNSRPSELVNNFIQELPYISGLLSIKYTM